MSDHAVASAGNEPPDHRPPLKITEWISMPLVKYISVIVLVFLGGWKANSYVNEVLGSINRVNQTVVEVVNKVDVMRSEFKADLAQRTSDRYTRTDHIIWALELERANANKIVVPPPPRREP